MIRDQLGIYRVPGESQGLIPITLALKIPRCVVIVGTDLGSSILGLLSAGRVIYAGLICEHRVWVLCMWIACVQKFRMNGQVFFGDLADHHSVQTPSC